MIWLLTAGGPENSTMVSAIEIYKNAFFYFKYGLASAQSVDILVICYLILVIGCLAVLFPLSWMVYGYFKSIPTGLDEAARVDGSSAFRTFCRIQWNYLMCAAIISSAPTLASFVVLQQHLIAGMISGAVKE